MGFHRFQGFLLLCPLYMSRHRSLFRLSQCYTTALWALIP